MKGNSKLIDQLNILLVDELTAISQYLAHYGIIKTRGYEKLAKYILDRINEEREHSELLTARINRLEGVPVTGEVGTIDPKTDAEEQLKSDCLLEYGAIAKYEKAISIAIECGDNTTRDMLAEIRADEDRHALNIEQYLIQIEEMTKQNWLSIQA